MNLNERSVYLAESIKKKMLRERDRLRRMYNDKGMSLTDISNHYGCSRQYVQMVFVSLGIARRDREEALRNSPRRHRSKFNFLPEHDKFIVENCDRMTDTEISKQIGKPVSAVTYRRLVVLKKKKIYRKNFTIEENMFIRKNYKRLTDIEIAFHLNRSLISITHHRNRVLKCSKRVVRSYTDAENIFIKENYAKLTDSQIAEVLNRSKASVAIHRHEVLGLAKVTRRKRR